MHQTTAQKPYVEPRSTGSRAAQHYNRVAIYVGASQALMHRGASEQDLCDVFALLNQLMVRLPRFLLMHFVALDEMNACRVQSRGGSF